MWHLHRASPLQISPVGVCPLQKSPHPRDYLQPPRASLTSGGPYKSGPWQKDRLRCSSCSVQGVWSNLLRHSPPVVPHTPQVVLPLHQPPSGQPATQYQQAVQPPGKSTRRGVTFDPSTDKTALVGSPSSQDHGRSITRGWGDGGQSISCPRGCRRRRVHSCHIRRVICPPDQHQVFHHQWHLKEPHLSREVSQRPPTMILHNWWQNSTAQGGRRTLSMCSGSTTNTTLPPLGRRSG